jgi:inner membrane protein
LDNITHTLAGLALVRTGLGRKSRFAGAALIVGSNLPDLDLVALVGGRLAFIDAHRGISHSLIGGCVLGALFGAGLWALGRFRPRGGPAADGDDGPPRQTRLGPLCGLALLAVLLHLGFDSLNDYGIRLLLPFTDRWYYGDIIFIVDPWFWLLLGGGAHLAMQRPSPRERLAWAGWAVLSIPVLIDSHPPMPARVIWLLGLLTLALLRFRTRAPSALWPRAAFGVLALYVAAVAGLHVLALGTARSALPERAPPPVTRLAAIPRPADPFRWNVVYETPEYIGAAVVPAIPGIPRAGDWFDPESFEKHLGDPRVQRALATPTGGVAARFCRYLFAEITEKPGGAADVAFHDARFAIRERHDFSVFTVHVE